MPDYEINDIKISLTRLEERMAYMQLQLNASLANSVSKDDFRPIKMLVYGGVGLFLTGIVGALLSLLIK